MGRKKHPEALTPAEQRVLEELRTGATNAEIAVRLGLSINTVKYHLANMLAKTGLTDRGELREWRMPAAGGANWWVRGAVGVGALVGVVAILLVAALSRGSSDAVPKEAWVAIVSHISSEADRVVLQEMTTGVQEELKADGGWQFASAQWSPDGQVLALGQISRSNVSLSRLDLVGRETRTATASFSGAFAPMWSPDSSRLIIVGFDKVMLADRDGRVLAEQPVASSGGDVWRWAPDSSRALRGDERGIYVWDRDGTATSVDPASLRWPVPMEGLSVFGLSETGKAIVIASDLPGGATGADGWFLADLSSGDVEPTDMAQVGFTGPDQFPESAELAEEYGPGIVRNAGPTVDGRGRAYWILNNDRMAARTLVIYTGDRVIETSLDGFSDFTLSIVLSGDWDPAPVLPAP